MPFERLADVDDATPNYVRALAVDDNGDFLYAAHDSGSTAAILKIRLSDFTVVDELALNAKYRQLSGAAISGNSLYYSSGITDWLVKIDLVTFTEAGSLLIDPSDTDGMQTCIIDGTTLYAGALASKLIIIDLDTFTETSRHTLTKVDPEDGKIRSLIVDDGILYIGTTGKRIHKMDTAAPGVPGFIDVIDSGDADLLTAFSDDSGFVYFTGGTDGTTPGATLFKINTDTFTLEDTLTVFSGSGEISGSFIDVGNLMAYVGYVDSIKFQYTKVDISSFTVVETIEGLGGGDVSIEAAVGMQGVAVDRTTFSSYLGTNSGNVGDQNTRIVKFDTFIPPAAVPETGGSLLKRPPTLFDYQTAMSRR